MGIKPLGQEKHNFTIVFQKKQRRMLGNELSVTLQTHLIKAVSDDSLFYGFTSFLFPYLLEN